MIQFLSFPETTPKHSCPNFIYKNVATEITPIETMATHPIQIIPAQKLTMVNGSAQIMLQNDSLNGYGYKVRTTSPNSYKVEPNIGIIKPLDSIKIFVSVKDEKPGCNDKFNILIYDFDHKKSAKELREYISQTKSPVVSHILLVDCKIKESPRLEQEKATLFAFLSFLMLIYLMPQLIKNYLFL